MNLEAKINKRKVELNHRHLFKNSEIFSTIKSNLSSNIIKNEIKFENRRPSVQYSEKRPDTFLHHLSKEQSEPNRSWVSAGTKTHLEKPESVLNAVLNNELKKIEETEIKVFDFSPISINQNFEFLEDDYHDDGLFLCGRWAQSSKSASRAAEKMTKYYQSKVIKTKPLVTASMMIDANGIQTKKDNINYVSDSNGKDCSIISDSFTFMGKSSRPASSHCSGKSYLSSSIPEYHDMEAKIELAIERNISKSQNFSVRYLKKKIEHPINDVSLKSIV